MGRTQLTMDVRGEGWRETVDPDCIGPLLGDCHNLLWLDIVDPGPAELELLRREFGFHELAIEDVEKLQVHQRPKYDTYQGYCFIVVYAAEHTADEFVARELQLFVGENFLVTIHRGPLTVLDEARRRWARHESRRDHGVGYLVYTVFDSLVDGYFPLQDWLGERMEAIERAVFMGAEGAAADLFRLRKQLLRIRRLLAPTGDVLAEVIRRGQPRFPESLGPYFADVHDHSLHVLGELDSYGDLLGTALDVHAESMFLRLGQIMKRLTAITVIIMVPNLVASIYGMNFEVLFPPTGWEYGFFVVVGLLAWMIIWGFIHSRHMDWL